jgi:hypothetical protein
MFALAIDLVLLATGGALFAGHRTLRRRARASEKPVPAPAPISAPSFQMPADHAAAPAARADRRVAAAAVDQLAGRLSHDRGRAAARASAERYLACLDPAEWLIERYVFIAGECIPHVVFGPTGVFLVAPGQGWTHNTLRRLNAAAHTLAAEMNGYPDPVRAVAVVPSGSPAEWRDEDGRGGWIMGEDWLVPWLQGVTDHGFAGGDVARLRAMLAAVDPTAPDRLTIPDALG